MSNISTEAVDKYVKKVVPKRNEILTRLEVYAHENHVPIVTTEVGQFLRTMVATIQAERILEVGTAIGYSGILMLEAYKNTNKLVTIEINEEVAEFAKLNFEAAGLSDRVEIKIGDAKTVLSDLEGTFDLIFIDAAKGQYKHYFDEATRLLSDRGIIICDNVLFKGMIADDGLVDKKKGSIVRNLRSFLDYVMNLEEYKSSLIPMGDGILISVRG